MAESKQQVTRRTFLGAAALMAAAGPAVAARAMQEPLQAVFTRADAMRWGMPRHAHLAACAGDAAEARAAARALALQYDAALADARLERVTVQGGGEAVLATLHYADGHRAVIQAGRCAGVPGGVVRFQEGEVVLSAEELSANAPTMAGRGAVLILRQLG